MGGGSAACGLGSCAGCCSGGICLGPQFQNAFSCGLNGAICGQCSIGASCQNGTCIPPVVADAGFDGGPGPSTDGGVGGPCLFDGQCQPPINGLCIPQTIVGTQTGWPGGYCSASCATTPCSAGNSCINAANQNGTPNWLCFKSCAGPRTGQSSCRNNYVCEFDLGNPSGQGVCFPRCDSPGFQCWAGTTCSTASGYCINSGP